MTKPLAACCLVSKLRCIERSFDFSFGPFPPIDLSCTFDPGAPCFLNEVISDDFDWTTQTGRTRSIYTGPLGAFGGAFYKYIETSSPRSPGDETVLESGDLPSGQSLCLTFHYHMYGSDIGKLKVIKSDSGSKSELFSLSGEQGNSWYFAVVDVFSGVSSRISIKGVSGSSYKGDIAIDDVRLVSGTCGNVKRLICTFEPGTTCFLTERQNDDFDWEQRKGPTSSTGTGPSAAADGAYYKFIEASSPRKNGDEAVLESPALPGSDMCIQFSYNMNGKGVGSLSVEKDDGTSVNTLFIEDKNLGDNWLSKAVNIPAIAGSKILIRGVRGSSYKGDIAIDFVRLSYGQCRNPQIHFCDFEQPDSCFMTNVGGDKFDWSFTRGRTPDNRTGPTINNGMYAYIEASSPRKKGDYALLSTNGLALPTGDLCLSFSYNMKGRLMGELVVLSGQAGHERSRWNKKGNQGDSWYQAYVTIPAVTTNDQLILIKGIKGNDFCGDIAIDDLSLISGVCV